MPIMYGFNNSYFILIIIAMVVAGIAQYNVSRNYYRFSQVASSTPFSGSEVARRILDANGLSHVAVTQQSGTLTDHYDPRTKVIRLSKDVYQGNSVASQAIAAHEVGHAIQDNLDYGPLKFRNAMLPAVNFSSRFVWILIIGGMFFNLPILMDIGILAFSATFIFQLVTLPVEFNASNRAIESLQGVFMQGEALAGGRKVLNAAALTYVASTVMVFLELLRLLDMNRRRK